jgi:hypothetical protein
MSFQLSKWYLDCISSDGDVFIGYSAELWRQPLSLTYESSLVHPAGAGARTRTSLRRRTPPRLDGGVLEWHSPALELQGRWVRAAAAVTETIFSSTEGKVDWSCCMPRAEAEITIAPGCSIRGVGYAEHLSITIPPWRMPIRQLRWGRIAAERDALVWIEWQGEFERTIVYRNGAAVRALHLDDTEIVLEDGLRIRLDCGCVLRDGALGATALASIPGIERLAPMRMLAARECKWRSRATISSAGAPEQQAWAIHELVQWPDSYTPHCSR